MSLSNAVQITQIGYYTCLALTPIGTAIGFYFHQCAHKNKYSLQIIKVFEHNVSPKLYHLRHHMSKTEYTRIHDYSIQIVVNLLKHDTNNHNVISEALKTTPIKFQIKQIQIYLTYRDIFKSFNIMATYILQHMVNKKLVKNELKETFEFMYHKYYNNYIEKNIPCKEYVKVCKKWMRR